MTPLWLQVVAGQICSWSLIVFILKRFLWCCFIRSVFCRVRRTVAHAIVVLMDYFQVLNAYFLCHLIRRRRLRVREQAGRHIDGPSRYPWTRPGVFMTQQACLRSFRFSAPALSLAVEVIRRAAGGWKWPPRHLSGGFVNSWGCNPQHPWQFKHW